MLYLSASSLDRQIELQTPAGSKDAYGQVAKEWTTVALAWAHKRGLGSRERFAAAQVQQQDSVIYTIRYNADVTQLWRVKDGDALLDITGLREIGRRQWLELTCIAGVKDGR